MEQIAVSTPLVFEDVELIGGYLNAILCSHTMPDDTRSDYSYPQLLPDGLLKHLLTILERSPHEDYQGIPRGGLSTQLILGRISEIHFSTDGMTRSYSLMHLTDGRYCLYRFDEREDTLQAAYYPDLADAPDFQTWEGWLEEYLTVDLPDQLYALRVDSAKNVDPILEALYIINVVNSYTLESSGGNLTIRVETPTSQRQIEEQRDQYLTWASLRIIDLVGDINTVTWAYPPTEELPEGVSWKITGNGKPHSVGEFRLAYNSEKTVFD